MGGFCGMVVVVIGFSRWPFEDHRVCALLGFVAFEMQFDAHCTDFMRDYSISLCCSFCLDCWSDICIFFRITWKESERRNSYTRI